MKKSSSYLDLIENFSWKSVTTSLEFSKFSIEYQIESDEYFFQLTLYCSFLFRSIRLEFRTLFNSNSSSWSITIESDEFAIWSDTESFETFLNRNVWKVSCIVIEKESSNWQLASRTFLTLYESIIFQFNFFDERAILIFFVESHTNCQDPDIIVTWLGITWHEDSEDNVAIEDKSRVRRIIRISEMIDES
jgi:hypothetical protein